jgi:hypothetical protein
VEGAYHARYALNVARGDYQNAAETMLTLAWALAERVEAEGEPAPLAQLRKQQEATLAAINCLSLIDPRFAFWAPPAARASVVPAQLTANGSRKRQHASPPAQRAPAPTAAAVDRKVSPPLSY